MKVLAFIVLLFSAFTHANQIARTQITIPLNEWSSQRVLSKAMGHIISSAGNSVDYVNISVDSQWGAFKRGAIDFQLEVWEPAMKYHFEQLLSQGDIVDLGTHQATVIEDWWYPNYVEKFCPSLPAWQALNQCVALFKKELSDTKGIYYGGPWDYGDADVIRALGINFTIHRLPDGLALWEQLSRSMAMEKPIILLNWSPNWTDKYAQGKFIEFPAYEEECETNPSWGLNKNYVKDCGNRKGGWLKKAATKNFQQNFPCAYQFIKQVNFTKEMIIEASALLVVEKLTEEQAAQSWINRYRDEINSWQANTCL